MTVKALRKQLMAAIAMVVVSAVALCSSTYAWFAANNKVIAEGMQVQATAEGGIEIAYVEGENVPAADKYSTIATANMTDATALYPTSTKAERKDNENTIGSPWYHAIAATANSSKAKEKSYTQLDLTNGAEGDKNYYVVKKFRIRSVSSSKLAKDLKVSKVTVTVAGGTAATAALDRSLRVAAVGTNGVALYAPYGYITEGDTKSISYKVATEVNDGNATMPADNNVTALFNDQPSGVITSGDIAADLGTDVNIYLWYEGEDPDHKSTNLATSIDTLKVSVEFEATIDGTQTSTANGTTQGQRDGALS